ncbi:glycosyltransferase family A protein [Flavobacterium sp. LC2016-12]|uniref:glycosyltransferase family 2 protein n=1 Tax=Flavobacterium sp. LC2016-12 TaxID=2783794 RepID=UPI00188A7DAA|nr:glycosyltransferase family A protein [Flavobacterium sp. LC2016-12]MBF4465655.1 glycosyltransferase family 2 protein [Flavobacterium sp. LC2016-12]
MCLHNFLVSVIITTCNRPHYLELTLKSVLEQSYQNIEIIVIDDDSKGNQNNEICSGYSNVYYEKIPKSGTPSTGRNIGIKKAKGEFIAFLDDDDLWIKDKIKIQVEILNNNLDFGLVHSPCQIIDSEGNLKSEIIGKSNHWRNKHGDVSLSMFGNFTLMMPTPLVRREIIEKVGFFNEKMLPNGEDAEFWTRCSFFTKFYYTEKVLAYYRIHDFNISKNKNGYIDYPLYLKKILVSMKKSKRIDSTQYKLLLQKCIKKQSLYRRQNFGRTIYNLMSLDFFWFTKITKTKFFF